MVTTPTPTPTCWKCGGPVFNSIFRGYVCPYCNQMKIAKKIALQQAAQIRAAQQEVRPPVYYVEPQHFDTAPPAYQQEYVEGSSTSNPQAKAPLPKSVSEFGGFIGGCVLIFCMGAAAWVATMAVWHHIVYPLAHLISFGMI